MNTKICCYPNKFWVITGVDAKTNKLIIRPLSSGEVLFADAVDVLFIGVRETVDLFSKNLNPTIHSNSHWRLAPQDPTSAINKDVSHKPIVDASMRYLAITMDIEGRISPHGAAEMCDLSLSSYHQMKRLYDPQVGLFALVSERRGRKPKNLKPQPTTQPPTQLTPPTAEAPATPRRKGR